MFTSLFLQGDVPIAGRSVARISQGSQTCVLALDETAGGAITSISLNIPGTPMAAATCLDGHPMAKKGEGARALQICFISSFIGGVLGILVLIFLTPVLAKWALGFGLNSISAAAIDYDAGFVAYLNGTEVARRSAPSDLAHDAAASAALTEVAADSQADIAITVGTAGIGIVGATGCAGSSTMVRGVITWSVRGSS